MMIDMHWATPHLHAAHELTYFERLVVHAVRQWANDRSRWCEVVLELNRAWGPRRATLLSKTLADLFHEIGIAARRTIRLFPPVCCHVGYDELALLNLLAAQQRGASIHAEALLAWLVDPRGRTRIRGLSEEAARTIFDAGYEFPLRTTEAPARTAQRALRIAS
jgi:hypothetical protein